MRAPWLAAVLRDAGLTVKEHGDWQGRGRDMAAIYGVVVHDTVTTTASTDDNVADLLRDGRPDLAGPLSQMGVDRQGRYWLIADGRCNHNGYGTWGNDALGIEVFCAGGLTGREESWNPAQREAVAVGVAAILAHIDLPASRCQGHKEQDPGRKIDPYGVDMDDLRARIEQGTDMPLTDADLTKIRELIQESEERTVRRLMLHKLRTGDAVGTILRNVEARTKRLVEMHVAATPGNANVAGIADAVRKELARALEE